MDRLATISGVLVAVAIGCAAWAQDSTSTPSNATPPTPAAITDTQLNGAGSWTPDGTYPSGAQRWNLNVTRNDDNTISGRVSVANSPVLGAGNVQGKIDGQSVSGTILDDSGNQLATFAGVITPSGMNGKYTDQTGEIGYWEWDAPLPQ